MPRFSNEYGACSIDNLPGCAQVAVSHGAFIFKHFRKLGHGTRNHALRLKRMKALGYDYVICTMVLGNSAERAILTHAGWSRLAGFYLSQSDQPIEIWGKSLR